MRECLGALDEVKRELSGVGPGRTQIITVCPLRAYAVRLCVSSAEKHIPYTSGASVWFCHCIKDFDMLQFDYNSEK